MGRPTTTPALSVELLRAVLDREPFGIAILSLPDLVFEYVNPAFQAYAPHKEMVGHPNDEVFPEMSALARPVLAALASGHTWRREDEQHRIRRSPDGPLETLYGTIEVTRLDFDGKPHLLVSAIDTTNRVHLQQENERLEREHLRRLGFAKALEGVNFVIHSSLDYDDIMRRALQEASRALGARAGAVFVGTEGTTSEARYVYGFPESFIGYSFPASTFPFSELMRETKQPIAVGRTEMQSLMNPAVAKMFGVKSLLAIPLVVRGELVGGIGLIYGRPHDFDDAELSFARAVGHAVSLALQNAELYARQERVADALQEALLTLPSEIAGLEFAHRYHSATEAVKVGGDFYDLFELEHEIVGITVGDMSGKGIDAAALTALVKNAVRAQATEKKGSPAGIIEVVNRVLYASSESEDFATIFFGLLNCNNGQFVYCNAGHTTTYLVRPDVIQELPSNSPIVGAFERESFSESVTTLEPAGLLFAYTDGLTEARSAGDFFGEKRLLAQLKGAYALPPSDVVAGAMDAVGAFTGGRLTDDVAVLAVRRR